MRTWLSKRSVPRYAFFVLWLVLMIELLSNDARNHWPKSSLAGLAFGVVGLLIVAVFYVRGTHNAS